ncbi:MAG: type II toxin-antitoxin system VapC family toxin [Pseudomonadota bacterium]
MIGLDTNVLVRFFVQDDAHQASIANALLMKLTPEIPGFVSNVVLAELIWVLAASYGIARDRIGAIVERLVNAKELVIENAACARRALAIFQSANVDFADALIAELAHEAGCTEVVTFDRGGKRAGMRLLV